MRCSAEDGQGRDDPRGASGAGNLPCTRRELAAHPKVPKVVASIAVRKQRGKGAGVALLQVTAHRSPQRDPLSAHGTPSVPPRCGRAEAVPGFPTGTRWGWHGPGEGRAPLTAPGDRSGQEGKESAQASHGSGQRAREGEGKGRHPPAVAAEGDAALPLEHDGVPALAGLRARPEPLCAGTPARPGQPPPAQQRTHTRTPTPRKKVISSSFLGHRLFATSRCKYRISPNGWTTSSAARAAGLSHGHRVTPNIVSRGRTGVTGGSAVVLPPPLCPQDVSAAATAPGWLPGTWWETPPAPPVPH